MEWPSEKTFTSVLGGNSRFLRHFGLAKCYRWPPYQIGLLTNGSLRSKSRRGQYCEEVPAASSAAAKRWGRCNPYDGQCTSKQGFGGRQCIQCETSFWGNPNVQCNPCDCNVYGAVTRQCNRETGQCICNPGIGGYKYDQCARGYLGDALYCEPCFDNYEQDAATGAYKKQFGSMSKKMEVIQGLLTNTISDREIEAINANVKQHLSESAKSEKQLQETSANIEFANIDVEELSKKTER
ncbi:hypothetical protein quinque_008832 [Culex quinquefasciatus]|uniref:Laminin EGF-like domain-containing protein n=1 Tax=Culex pipiens pipiens TaxID=38569 RepID=A0ABD1CNW9_CULPP